MCEHLALHSHIRPRAGRELLRNLAVSRHAHQYGVHFGGKGGITIVPFKGFAVVGEVHPADAAVFVGNEAVKTHGEIEDHLSFHKPSSQEWMLFIISCARIQAQAGRYALPFAAFRGKIK